MGVIHLVLEEITSISLSNTESSVVILKITVGSFKTSKMPTSILAIVGLNGIPMEISFICLYIIISKLNSINMCHLTSAVYLPVFISKWTLTFPLTLCIIVICPLPSHIPEAVFIDLMKFAASMTEVLKFLIFYKYRIRQKYLLHNDKTLVAMLSSSS